MTVAAQNPGPYRATTAREWFPRRFFSVLLFFCVWSGLLWSAERTTVTILATSDLHGYIFPFDYYGNRPASRGLAKAATILKAIRKEKPHALLVDCGDTIEGSPLVYLHARQVLAKDPQAGPNPMMLAMNELDYDAMVVGNHEFNFGMEVLLRAKKDAQFEWLSANVTAAATAEEALALRKRDVDKAFRSVEERVFTPMTVEEVDGVTVAIIGLTTPAVPNWERPENIESYHFESPVEAAREWARYARENRHADVVIVAAHLGLERDLDTAQPFPGQLPGENAVYQIAQAVPGIDGIIFGHTHQELSGRSLNGVILVQPKNWGQSVGEMTLTLERETPEGTTEPGPWKVVGKSSRTIPVTDLVEADPEILRITESYHEAAQKYLDAPVAEAKAPLETRLGRVMDTAALDAIHEVQLSAAKADVSLAAMFDTSLTIARGSVTVRQIAALYPYENMLVAVEATGQMLKEALEHAARFYNGFDPAHPGPLLNPQVFGFNYDTAAGVTYEIDLTRPPGQRIVNLRRGGAPLDPQQKLRLAINSYRKAGGGGYTMFRDAKVLWQSSQDIRQLMIDYFTAKKTIEDKVDRHWRIVPEAAEKLLLSKADGNQ